MFTGLARREAPTAEQDRCKVAHATASLYALIAVQARRNPDAAAILAPGRLPLNFGGLLAQIDHVRTTLNRCGLGRGDRIALLAGRGPETAVAALGIASCAVCVPLNDASALTELEAGLVQTGANALLVPATTDGAVKSLAVAAGISLFEYSIEEETSAGSFRLNGGAAAEVVQGGWASAADVALVLRTSGTTAQAKIVPISHENICARTDKVRRMFGIRQTDRCLNLLPLCYSFGLNVGLMAPLAAGCAVIFPSTGNVESFPAWISEFSPTWYAANSTHHQAILEILQRNRNGRGSYRLRFAVSGGSPLQARLRLRLEEKLGAPVLDYYGTTEVGAITGEPPVGKREPGTVGCSPDEDVGIMDADGTLLESGKEGEVVVRGPIVFGGYEKDPVANERAFLGEWYRTGDHGAIDADGFVRLVGRIDEVINRGGEKIAPLEIDEALLGHEAVAQAISFPIPHATMHQEIAAAVVLRNGAAITGDQLRRFLATRLASYKVPRFILCTSELPRGPTGKLSRSGLAAYFRLDTPAASSAQFNPRTRIQEILLKLWRDVLNRQDIGCDDDFFLCGGDSLSAVDLLHRVQTELQYHLPLTILTEAPTVSKLEIILETGTLGAPNNIRVNVPGTRRPLFAVCGLFGHALRLLPVLRSLGADQPCYALQPPGMDWSSVGCATLAEIATYYIGEVKAAQPRGPYRLLGASFGGLVVFEMALQLQKMGEPIDQLLMVDTNPPTCMVGGSPDIWTTDIILDAKPKPANSIETINLAVAHAHLGMTQNYTLDDRLTDNVFRGQLTYFYCSPVVRQDRRRLWQHFATGFRLLQLAGRHGTFHQEPQYTALQKLLLGCDLTMTDPASVYDRSYQIDESNCAERIVSSNGDIYSIQREHVQGYVDQVKFDVDAIYISGWAVEACMRRPAGKVAVFVGGEFIGYGASGEFRPDVVEHLNAPSAMYAGYYFRFRVANRLKGLPRVFVLSGDGSATELEVLTMS
jgi:oxalate---CoA ligase